MAHLLFLSWWWPYPANNGSKIRIYNLLRHLGQRHRVTLLSFADPGDATPEALDHLRTFCAHVEAVPKPIYRPQAIKATLGYLSRWPRSLVDVYSTALAERIQSILGQSSPVDMIIASQLQTMRYLELAPHIPALLEEVEVSGFYERVKNAAGTASRLRAQMTVTKLEKALRSLLERRVAFTVVSDTEAAYIRQFAPAHAQIDVVPNGVDTTANRPDQRVIPEPYSLIYTGSVTYSANYDAVQYFVREVLPRLRQYAPQTRLTITGSTKNVDIHDLAAQPGVTFSGYLPSVASAVQSSWAVIAPLRLGGGTRLKILEAMALGTPVVATNKGAEGLAIHPGRDILVADDPEALAENIYTLFEDADLRARLAQAGRALVEQQYDWNIIGSRLATLVEQRNAN